MGLSYTPTTFSASTTMSSSAMNTNFTAMQSSSADFTGTWVAENNTSIGLLIEDYSLTTPLSQNVIRIRPPLTSPDRGIVFSSLKGKAVSDRIGINTSGKILTGLVADNSSGTTGTPYTFYNLISGIGSGTFNALNAGTFRYTASGFMLNCGTNAGSGGSAASIGYGNVTNTTIDVYCSAGVPWICTVGSQ